MPEDRHRISLDKAVTFVARAREEKLLPVKGWLVGREIITEILAQPGAAGLRAYLGVGDDGVPTLVYMAVDDQGGDMYRGVLAEYVWPCPPDCGPSSPFNSAE